ncbi:MAG TPA: hypothetical protein PKE26_17265 [Kiritimatiellia bacterium]|nr:hypothetical protein [Kiritimatiellia bacterium]HMP00850.1 hypothetical protein [Kiritimatiellia bacterium]
MNTQAPTCNVCNQGTLTKKKKFRLSGPAVVIGYIFLIPSVFGILFGLVLLFGTGAATSESSQTMKQQIRNQLSSANIPSQLIDKVLNYEVITQSQRDALTQNQRITLESAEFSYKAGTVGTGAGAAIAGGFSIFVIFSSFIGGLLGWLLTMKKKVLQCGNCGAVVNAS